MVVSYRLSFVTMQGGAFSLFLNKKKLLQILLMYFSDCKSSQSARRIRKKKTTSCTGLEVASKTKIGHWPGAWLSRFSLWLLCRRSNPSWQKIAFFIDRIRVRTGFFTLYVPMNLNQTEFEKKVAPLVCLLLPVGLSWKEIPNAQKMEMFGNSRNATDVFVFLFDSVWLWHTHAHASTHTHARMLLNLWAMLNPGVESFPNW